MKNKKSITPAARTIMVTKPTFMFALIGVLKYKDDIGTADGVLAEVKSVLDFNTMNSTFVN